MDAANEVLRAALLNWLRADDPNGAYTDADCDAEGLPRLTLEEALSLVVAAKMGVP